VGKLHKLKIEGGENSVPAFIFTLTTDQQLPLMQYTEKKAPVFKYITVQRLFETLENKDIQNREKLYII